MHKDTAGNGDTTEGCLVEMERKEKDIFFYKENKTYRMDTKYYLVLYI